MKIYNTKNTELYKKIFMGVFFVLVAMVVFNLPNPTRTTDYVHNNSDTEEISGTPAIEDGLAETLGPDFLYVQRLGIRTPIVYVEGQNESVFQKGLEDGVVHYPGTANLGEFGNAYIFGHSSDFFFAKGDYKTIFARLPELKTGDTIHVTGREGDLYTYTVVEGRIIERDDLSVLSQYDNEKKLLTLQTSYPIGTADKRYIVVAEMK